MYDPQPPPTTSAPSDVRFPVWRCCRCKTLVSPLPPACRSCGGVELFPVSVSGFGTVVSWKAMTRSGSSRDEESAILAIIELDAGPWLYAWVSGEPPTGHSRVVVWRRGRNQRLPVFALAASEGGDRQRGGEVSMARMPRAA